MGRPRPNIGTGSIWLYHRFTLSFRDVEDLLAERGILVSYTVQEFCCQQSRHGIAGLL